MQMTSKPAFFAFQRKSIAILLLAALILTLYACATVSENERYQPLAATASDLARAVMRYADEHPAEAGSVDDRELVRRATAYDPKLLEPYNGLVVRGTVDGVILVCSPDGRRGLFEDAECTDKVDRLLWPNQDAPCRFTLKCE